MNKIDFPRIGVDGVVRIQEDIEVLYFNRFFKNIHGRLLKLQGTIVPTSDEYRVLSIIIKFLETILLALPHKLQKFSLLWDKALMIYNISDQFKDKLLSTFNYDYHRRKNLIEHAKYLNVKSCPYCNMHYTLYAEKNGGTEKLAKFQFDHFYPKDSYPILSMSLYNLIPSCNICNHAKSTKTTLSLDFHPYHSDISKKFKFRLNNPINLYLGQHKKDIIDIDLVANGLNSQQDVDAFSDAFNLKVLYQRHRDVAQEVFDKAYEYPYYSNPDNFKWLSNCQPDYIKRLWMGTYISEQDIHKRPMTKFIQDLWEQAIGIKVSITQGRAT